MTIENRPQYPAHRIWTDCNSHGVYWAQCDCGEWCTMPQYDNNGEAKRAGQDHLDTVRSR
jgi:hypothetical protein